MLKTEGLGKQKIQIYETYKNTVMPHGRQFMPKHMTWQRQQFVKTHSQIIHYHTGNVYCDIVPNFLALILLTRKHMISIPTPFLQISFHIYHLIARCT